MRFLSSLLTLTLFLSLPFLSLGQVTERNCGTMDNLEQLRQLDPSIETTMQQIEEFTQRFQSNETRMVVTIPVVFHVVLNPSQGEAISNAQLQSQSNVLNEDFRRTNSDADNYWGSLGSDTEIEFCLATEDPNGNPTSGITTTNTTVSSHGTNNSVKFTSQGGKDAWDTDSYLNIWVCDIGGGILGYAQFPGGPANTDGVVLDFRYTGRNGSAIAPFDQGRTGTHEVGHYLNLRHIWGDGGCGADDFVGDTPKSNRPNYNCPIGIRHCGSVDMVQNYMDYTDDACMNLFTGGQKTRMQAALSGPRASLLTSSGCGGGGGPTCNAPSGLSASGATQTSATLNWSAASGAVDYDIEIQVAGSGSWSSVGTTSSTSIGASGLTCGTNYEFRVRTNCSGSSSGFSSASGFSTSSCSGGNCDAPTNVTVSNIFKKKATLSWTAASGAVSYEAQYKQLSASNWSTKTTSGTSVNMTALSQGSVYETRVRSICSGSNSAYTAGPNFTAGSSTRIIGSASAIALYPNPVNDILTIEFTSLESERVNVVLTDMAGKVLRKYLDHPALEEGYLEMNLSQLESGMYLIRIQDRDGFQQTEKVVVTH